MTPWHRLSPERRELLEGLAAEYARLYGKGRTMLAIDGPEGAGTAAFADDLATALRRTGHTVLRASIEGFHHPREFRHRRGRYEAEGRYRDSFDLATLRRVLIEPFRLGGSATFVTEAFDQRRDAPVEPKWEDAPPDAVLVIDGVFLNRPELRDLWHWSIWVDADAEVRAERRRAAEGIEPGSPVAERDEGAQRLYVAEADPHLRAGAIVDHTDPDRPQRRYADYCSIPPPPSSARKRGATGRAR